MLIVFKARECSSVAMLPADGRRILAVLGKVPDDPTGIVTVDALPQTIATLRAAISADQAAHPANSHEPRDGKEGDDEEPPVHLYQRAQPILALLERAAATSVPVTWGV